MRVAILTLLLASCGPIITTNPQIEGGIAKAVRKAKCQGYTKRLDDFKTTVLKPEFVINGVGGITYKGQAVAGYYDVARDTLVLVEQSDMTDVAEHEATHRIYRWNDTPRYERTKSHPPDFLMPDC